MTTQGSEEALAALDYQSYERDMKKLGWVTKVCGSEFTCYDGCAAVKLRFKRTRGYKPFSMLEVMVACKHPGAGKADVFLSHAQKEPFSMTLDAMRCYELRRQKFIKFFVDVFALRQCVQDFVLEVVQDAIKKIGCTVLLCEPWANPFTLSRTFCAFEVYATVEGQVLSPPLLGGPI